jgi:hypothetical protein
MHIDNLRYEIKGVGNHEHLIGKRRAPRHPCSRSIRQIPYPTDETGAHKQQSVVDHSTGLDLASNFRFAIFAHLCAENRRGREQFGGLVSIHIAMRCINTATGYKSPVVCAGRKSAHCITALTWLPRQFDDCVKELICKVSKVIRIPISSEKPSTLGNTTGCPARNAGDRMATV